MKNTAFYSLILLLPICVRAAQFDNFESYTTGTAGAPWMPTQGSPLIGKEADGNQYIESFGSYCLLGDHAVPAQDSATTVFYRIYKPAGTSPDCSVGLSDLSAPTGDWNDFEVYVVIVGGELRARNGTSNTAIISPMNSGVWYNIWLILNNSSNTYDVYVTNGSASATASDRKASNFVFRKASSNPLAAFKIYGRPEYGPVWVDDIYITNGIDLTNPAAAVSPLIIHNPSNSSIKQSEEAIFTTVFACQTSPSTIWYKAASPADIPIDTSLPAFDLQLDYDPLTRHYTSTLKILDCTVSNSGYYYCKIFDESGYSRSSASALLIVYGLSAHWTLNKDRYISGSYLDELAGLPAYAAGACSFTNGADGTPDGAGLISPSGGWAESSIFDPVAQSGQMTVSFWAKTSDWGTSQEDLLAESISDEILIVPNGLKADGRWQHIGIVFDGTTGRLYVDGLLQAQGLWKMPQDTTAVIRFGTAGTGQSIFSGAIDDIRVYNYALTEFEIADLRYDFSGISSCILDFDAHYDFAGPDGTSDCIIDILDLAAFAAAFLEADPARDLTGPDGLPDGIVDLQEFAEFASIWLACGLYPVCN